MYILPALCLDMITLKLIFFRQTQAGQAEGCHNVSSANKQFLCCVVDRSYDTGLTKCYSTKNRTASLDQGTRSCNSQPLSHWKKHFGSLTKTYFLQAVAKFLSLLFASEVLPGHEVHCSRHNEIPRSCDSTGLSLA